MALTANTVPSQVPDLACPFDAQLAFTENQVIATTGYLNNLNSGQIDFGGANPSSGAGRKEGIWSIDVKSIDVSSVDEIYKFHLFGSNDVAFGNGNVELLAFHDVAAATAGRQVATILGASPAMPPTGSAGTIFRIPFLTLMQRIVYRYVRAYVVIAGTTPTVTVTSWLSRAEIKV